MFMNEAQPVRDLTAAIGARFKELGNSVLRVFVLNEVSGSTTPSTTKRSSSSDSERDDDDMDITAPPTRFELEPGWQSLEANEPGPELSNNQLIVVYETLTEPPQKPSESIIELVVQQCTKYPLISRAKFNTVCSFCLKDHSLDTESVSINLPRCTRCFRSSYCST